MSDVNFDKIVICHPRGTYQSYICQWVMLLMIEDRDIKTKF